MLNITKEMNDSKLSVALEGRLDTVTAPKLEEEVNANLEGITELVFDFAKLEYISSAGLRVFLAAQKIMNKQGSLTICNTSDEVKEIFDVTGFSDIFNIV